MTVARGTWRTRRRVPRVRVVEPGRTAGGNAPRRGPRSRRPCTMGMISASAAMARRAPALTGAARLSLSAIPRPVRSSSRPTRTTTVVLTPEVGWSQAMPWRARPTSASARIWPDGSGVALERVAIASAAEGVLHLGVQPCDDGCGCGWIESGLNDNHALMVFADGHVSRLVLAGSRCSHATGIGSLPEVAGRRAAAAARSSSRARSTSRCSTDAALITQGVQGAAHHRRRWAPMSPDARLAARCGYVAGPFSGAGRRWHRPLGSHRRSCTGRGAKARRPASIRCVASPSEPPVACAIMRPGRRSLAPRQPASAKFGSGAAAHFGGGAASTASLARRTRAAALCTATSSPGSSAATARPSNAASASRAAAIAPVEISMDPFKQWGLTNGVKRHQTVEEEARPPGHDARGARRRARHDAHGAHDARARSRRPGTTRTARTTLDPSRRSASERDRCARDQGWRRRRWRARVSPTAHASTCPRRRRSRRARVIGHHGGGPHPPLALDEVAAARARRAWAVPSTRTSPDGAPSHAPSSARPQYVSDSVAGWAKTLR